MLVLTSEDDVKKSITELKEQFCEAEMSSDGTADRVHVGLACQYLRRSYLVSPQGQR